MARRRLTAAERRRAQERELIPSIRRRARGWFIRAVMALAVAGGLLLVYPFLAACAGVLGLAFAGQGLRVAVDAQRLEDGE